MHTCVGGRRGGGGGCRLGAHLCGGKGEVHTCVEVRPGGEGGGGLQAGCTPVWR